MTTEHSPSDSSLGDVELDEADPLPAADADGLLIPELMDTPEPGAVQHRDPTVVAMEAATRAALAAPNIAGRDEFLAMCLQARMLSMSELAPDHIRGKPYDALLILWTARDLGIPPTAAMRKIAVIGGNPTLETQLLCALVRRHGLGSVVPVDENMAQDPPTYAKARVLGPDGRQLGPDIIFTWQDAVDAEYADPTCQPSHHNIRKLRKRRRDGTTYEVDGCWCKDGYRKNLRDMLYWRAAARACRFYFSEAGLGMYSPEEVATFTDADGRAIDPMNVELPEGFSDPDAERRAQQAAADQPAAPDELWAMQERIWLLPEQLRADLAKNWAQNIGHKAYVLPQRLVKRANAMINGFHGQARSAGIDLDEALTDLRDQLARRLLWRLNGWLALDGPVPEPTTAAEQAAAAPEQAEDTDIPAEHPEPASDAPAAQPQDVGSGASDSADAQSPTGEDDAPEPTTDDDGRDWADEMRNLAKRVQQVGADVPAEVVERIVAEVKPMHHATVNKQLGEAGVPADGPIDMRRMHLSLVKMRAWLAEHGTDMPNPHATLCAHGRAVGYCTEPDCPNVEQPF